MAFGILHVVATPLGNLEDATRRLVRVLRESALILAEDTRRTRQLCEALGIDSPPRIARCDEHAEARRVDEVLELLRGGQDVALVSDAGTPGIADPGFRLVAAAHAAGLPVSPVPGPSAVTAALSASGLPSDAFVFEGFLPRKGGPRRRLLAALADEPRTIVLYETPHRAAESFADAAEILGTSRRAFLGRELTKLHEECVATTLGELAARAAREEMRGEIVLVIAGAERSPEAISDEELLAEVETLVASGSTEKDALRTVAKAHGLHKRDLYRLVKIEERDRDEP
jgi:16S rRNA (cytidine1402-2'-O)-methyltransferase